MKVEDIKNATIEQLTLEFDIQIIYMCMGTDDKKMVNELALELENRGEYNLFQKYQREVIQASRR